MKPRFNQGFSWDELQTASHEEQKDCNNQCNHFLNELWYGSLENEKQQPFIGFVRSYSRKGKLVKSLPAFLIHPSSLHYDNKAIDELLEGIVDALTSFENQNSLSSNKMIEATFVD